MKDLRQYERYPARWSCIITFDDHPGKTYHGRTHDLSQAGAAVLTDHNLHTSSQFTLRLAVPPTHSHERPLILEFRCRMAYSVHSDRHCCFRHGIQFVSYLGAAKTQLQRVLSQHFLPDTERYTG